MASSPFNSTSNLLNFHPLKPENPSNYVVKPISTSFAKPQEDKQSYFTSVSTFSRNGQLHEALTALSHMNNNGLGVGPEFYVELLQGCVCERALSLGQQIHGLITKKGDTYARNEYIETKLVIFYAKCDNVANANKLFTRLSSKNVFSWAAMIGLNSRLGRNDQALLGYCRILESGISPDNFVIPNVFKACSGNKCVSFGRGVHGYVIKVGLIGCVYVASSLLDMYGKCGFVEDAKRVFDAMVDRNVVVRNSMIVNYVQNGMNEEAIHMFYDMMFDGVEPTRVSISSLLSASANLRALDEGRQGHAMAVLYGLELGTILGSSIINFYSKLGLIEDAELVFERMAESEKDVVTWNLLISCYVQRGLVANALNVCRKMSLLGMKFDCVTMASLFSACADNNDVKLGKEGHCYCIRHGVNLDVVVVASMVDMYAKGGKLDYARRVFDSSVEKDIVVWNTLLAAFSEYGLSGEAMKLFYDMQLHGLHPNVISWNSLISALMRNQLVDEAKHMFSQMQLDGIEPNVVTWTIILSGLAQNGVGLEAVSFFRQMQEARVQPNDMSLTALLSVCINMTSLLTGKAVHGYITRRWLQSLEIETSLVDMYAKCGSIAQARNVFNMTSGKKLALYNAMISACGLHSRAQDGLMLYKNMTEEDMEPDDVTFTGILSACAHEGLIETGVRVFSDIVSKYNRKPTLEHYGCLVRLLSRCDLSQAMNLILRMPFKLDEQMLGSILSVCKERDQVELGEYLSTNLFRIEPDNAANYVTLSNVYASAGEWAKASGWRKVMKRRGLEKDPGCSWVEIRSEFHVFIADDRSHPRKDEIITTLAILQQEMRLKSRDFSLEILSS